MVRRRGLEPLEFTRLLWHCGAILGPSLRNVRASTPPDFSFYGLIAQFCSDFPFAAGLDTLTTMIQKRAPQSIAEEVNQQVEALLCTGQWLDRNTLEFRRVWRETEKLANANLGKSLALQAALEAARGDDQSALTFLARLEQTGSAQYLPALVTVLAELGRFSESLIPYRKIIDPAFGQTHFLQQGVPNGGFFSYIEALDKAQGPMHMTVASKSEGEVRTVAEILACNGDSEEDVAGVMDIAGEVMKDHKLRRLFHHPELRSYPAPRDGQPPFFACHLLVDTTEEDALDLTCEFVERLAESALKIPVSMVLSFKGVKGG